jgi:lipopolysaccharide export system protein LptC
MQPRLSSQESARLDRVLMQPRRLPRSSILAPLVPWLRLGFPLLATIAVMIGLVWPLVFSGGAFRLSSVPVAPSNNSYMRMDNPRFTGSDGQERQFNVTATAATQKKIDDPTLDLTTPKGDLIAPQGSWMSLSANTGRYDQKKQHLDLDGKVEFLRDDGYQVATEKASIDLKAGFASGNTPVEGHGPAGTINSQGFRILDRGRTIEFTGKAHLILHDTEKLPGLSGETQ